MLPSPMAHHHDGLEKKYQGRVDFLYLHTGEPRTEAAKRTLGFKSTPQIILVHPNGTKFKEWNGIVPEAELAGGLDALLKAQPSK